MRILGDIRDEHLIWRDRIKLSIKDVGGNGQVVFAVSGVDEFTLPYRL